MAADVQSFAENLFQKECFALYSHLCMSWWGTASSWLSSWNVCAETVLERCAMKYCTFYHNFTPYIVSQTVLKQYWNNIFTKNPQNKKRLYVIRGDNIAVIGEIDEEVESRIDLSSIRAPPLKVLVHWEGFLMKKFEIIFQNIVFGWNRKTNSSFEIWTRNINSINQKSKLLIILIKLYLFQV